MKMHSDNGKILPVPLLSVKPKQNLIKLQELTVIAKLRTHAVIHISNTGKMKEV